MKRFYLFPLLLVFLAACGPEGPLPGPAVAPVLQQPTVNADAGTVTLNWSESAGATGYNVYRSQTQAFGVGPENRVAQDIQPTTYADNIAVLDDGIYFYKVTAINAVGESNPSNEVSVTVGDPDPVDPGPVDPGPVDPGPVDPGPVDPGPVDPGPVDPTPVPEPGDAVVDLTFDEAEEGTLADTGFTLVQGGEAFFNPANLNLDTDAGTLTIDAQPGLQFQAANTLENGLGLPVDATGAARIIETTFVKPPFPGALAQQAGLWYGQPGNQDNYVKLVVISAAPNPAFSQIELRREIGGQTAENPTSLRRTSGFSIPNNAVVTLRMVVQPNGTATGYYSIDGGAFQQVAIGGVEIPGLVAGDSAAGIMASRRNDPIGPLNVVFNEFSVSEVAAE